MGNKMPALEAATLLNQTCILVNLIILLGDNMGDMADLYDYWDDNPHEEDELIERIKNGIWETADHEELKISEMETSHIINSMNWIKRNTDSHDYMYDYLQKFEEELGRRR